MHSPLQSPLQPVMRSPLEFRRRGGGSAFDPAALFEGGIQGILFDARPATWLFQDVAGSSAVTDPGQTVKRVSDLSGNGNHATQSSDGSAPSS